MGYRSEPHLLKLKNHYLVLIIPPSNEIYSTNKCRRFYNINMRRPKPSFRKKLLFFSKRSNLRVPAQKKTKLLKSTVFIPSNFEVPNTTILNLEIGCLPHYCFLISKKILSKKNEKQQNILQWKKPGFLTSTNFLCMRPNIEKKIISKSWTIWELWLLQLLYILWQSNFPALNRLWSNNHILLYDCCPLNFAEKTPSKMCQFSLSNVMSWIESSLPQN